MPRKRWLAFVAVAASLAVLAPTLAPIVTQTAEPAYSVERSEGDIEIRAYPPMLVAEVQTQGERVAAIGEGFRLLAGYIFGGNKPNTKIEMTVPVTQQAGEKIAMTVPVTQQSDGSTWRVRFVMPQSYTAQTLPQPNEARIKIIAEPARRFAIIRFSGRANDTNLATYQAKLEAFVTASRLSGTGKPVFAFYNPPWTIPLFKRNEIMLELAL
jgi:DNA gyrase inhibitor GyrI